MHPCLIISPCDCGISHYKTTINNPVYKRYDLGFRMRMDMTELQAYMIGKGYIPINTVGNKIYYSKVRI